MPISLLPGLTAALAETARQLANWERLAPLEEQILRRGRGAFLVRWFGPLVPEKRLGLHIGIFNIEELKGRYELVRRSMPSRATALNLTGPLAGIAGVAIGMTMSLPGSILLAPYLHDLFDLLDDAWWKTPATLLYTVLGNWVMPVLGPLASGAVGIPVLGALAIGSVLGGDPSVRGSYELLGSAAMMIDAFLGFWAQIAGPLDQIRNPVVRAMVEIAQRFAELFAQLLGFVSIVVVHVLPLVPHMVAQFRALKDLGEAIFAVVSDAVTSLVSALMAPFVAGFGIEAFLRGLFAVFAALPGKIIDAVAALIDDSKLELQFVALRIKIRLGLWIIGLADRIVAAWKETPLSKLIERLKVLNALRPEITEEFLTIHSMPAEKGTDWDDIEATLRSRWINVLQGTIGPTVGDRLADTIAAVRAVKIPGLPDLTIPELPTLPSLPDASKFKLENRSPATVDFGAEATRLWTEAKASEAIRRLPTAITRRPVSAFKDLLAANPAPSAPDVRALSMRDAIYLAVGRVLPAALRVHAPALREAFDALDCKIHDMDPTAGPLPDHPQIELRDSGLLRPVVGMLTIRSQGGFAPDLRVFSDLVMAALQQQTYRAANSAVGAF